MQNLPFFSIVMPVYNVEEHLSQAVESVLAQTFSDFELILVDDCSPDGSGALCDQYAQSDTRVRVCHLAENGGLSNARNQGIKAAHGTYITFIDSDDYVTDDLLQTVYDSLQKNWADAVVFGMVEDYFDADGTLLKSYSISYENDLYITDRETLRKEVIELERRTLLGYSTNTFYRLDILKENSIFFKKITMIEDILFNLDFVPFAETANILKFAPYHYMKRADNSLTNKFVKDYYTLHRRRVCDLLKLYESWGMCTTQVYSVLADIYVRYIFSALQRNCAPQAKMKHRDRVQWLRDLYRDDLYLALAPYMHGSNLVVRILSELLAHKNITLCLTLGRVIYIVKTYLPGLFSRAKQNR